MMSLKNRLVLLTVFALIGTSLSAQLQKAQANYIYNFTRFIEWPASAQNGEFVIGVLGKNHPITAELNATASQRTVGAQNVKVVEFQTTDQITHCQMLFVPDEKSSSLKKIHEKFGNTPMMVITEEQEWTPTESSLNFVVVDSKLAFQINTPSLKSKQLKVSEKLVALSK